MLPHLDHGIRHVDDPVIRELRPGLGAQLVEALRELGRVVRKWDLGLHLVHVADQHVLVPGVVGKATLSSSVTNVWVVLAFIFLREPAEITR